jgi:hypothetical protein
MIRGMGSFTGLFILMPHWLDQQNLDMIEKYKKETGGLLLYDHSLPGILATNIFLIYLIRNLDLTF